MSDAKEQSVPSPKTRIQLPPLQVPKRRVSASWTENLEPSMDIKSPPAIKSPEEKPGPSRIRPSPEEEVATFPKPTPSPQIESQAEDSRIQREDSREEKPEKRGRRGSIGTIKDQLLKFKMKAGKVLEDVHDRLVEDHSSVAVAPLSLPATPSQDLTSGAEMDEASSVEGRKSPTLSQSSKRTSTSAELKASMRSKLRKQAEQTVERKRGSVHLAKRLQRRLTIHQEEGPTEGELQSVDEQIEKTLKIGARFLQEQASLNPPDDVQYAFFVDDYEKEPPPRVIGSVMDYRRAEMVDNDENQGLLTYYDARPSDLEAERPMTSSIMEQRLSPAFFTNGRLRTIEESQYTKPLKTIQREDVPYNYVKAEPWETFVDEIRGSDYVQLDIFIGTVSMEQHPLCGDEDKIVGRLHALYEEQVKRINEMTDTLVNIENLPSGANPSALREHVDSLYRDIRRAAEGLRREYGELENCRNRQGYSTSPLRYTIDEEDESSSLLGKLTMDGPVTPIGTLPQAERSRLDLLKKTSVHVILHFNDMFVCKSESLPLNDFQYRFDQLFNLEIVSEPKTITATIVEKSGTTKKTIAKVNIPLPSDSEEDSLQPHHIPFTSTEGSISGFILAHAKWSSEARARRRESAAPAQPNEDTPFSIIPPGVRLVSDEEFDSNPRWDALERRARKRNGNERIPIDASDIDTSTSAHLDERRHRPSFRTAIDGMRALGLAHAVKLRTRLLEREQDVSTMSYSEIVREEPLPGLFGAIGSLFGPADLSRKLKPMRKMPDRQQVLAPTPLNSKPTNKSIEFLTFFVQIGD
ncbi:unnamed protein product [Cylicocyclus nassatus]|uniref:CC2D2A N-terminal C2 domain-containing protein n=1 Tax=Cylicocyclus nassatus TaxID=53992 RepID=A0AA36M1P7_CYLNA|nr:unnamed protein product [Cylicocyclus nassatus]